METRELLLQEAEDKNKWENHESLICENNSRKNETSLDICSSKFELTSHLTINEVDKEAIDLLAQIFHDTTIHEPMEIYFKNIVKRASPPLSCKSSSPPLPSHENSTLDNYNHLCIIRHHTFYNNDASSIAKNDITMAVIISKNDV